MWLCDTYCRTDMESVQENAKSACVRLEDELEDELSLAGLDATELEYMDADERREALEDAGLDPDDYDFD